MIANSSRMMIPGRLRRSLVERVIRGLLGSVLMLLITSCGGGTRGSGGQLFDGFIGDPSGKGLPNVTVAFLASGDSGVSDAQGRFVIETQGLAGALDVILERGDFRATTTTAPVPADAKRVRLTLTVFGGQQPSVTSSVEVIERADAGGGSEQRPGGSGDNGQRDDDSRDDADGNLTSWSSFAVGQRVKARGRYQGGVLILERLELDD